MSLADQHSTPSPLSQALIALRKERGWSRTRLARELHRLGLEMNLSVPSVTAIERATMRHELGENLPRASDIYAQLYPRALGIAAEDLFPVQSRLALPGQFSVTIHQFIPVMLGDCGDRLNSALAADPTEIGWAQAHQAGLAWPQADPATNATVTVFAWNVAVAHLATQLSFASISELAIWRRRSHRQLRQQVAEHLGSLVQRDLAADYVLTCLWLTEPMWEDADLHTAIHLLCSPRSLLGTGENDLDDDLEHALMIEEKLFRDGYAPSDHIDVGVDGITLGRASWAGVAYHPLNTRAALAESELVNCELLVQGLWALCDDIQRQGNAGTDPAMPVGHDWRWLRSCRARLTTPAPTEPNQVRRLRAGIVQTSDLATKIGEAIELLKETA